MQDFIAKETDINGQIGTVTVKQYDNLSRFLHVKLADNDNPETSIFNLTGCTAKLYMDIPGSTPAYIDGEISDAEEGILSFTLPSGLTQAAGDFQCEIRIMNATEQSVISTNPFTMTVKKSIFDSAALEATPGFSVLDALTLQVYANKSRLNELVAISESGDFPSGTVESEVIDARTDHNGVTHASAGDALRSVGAAAKNAAVTDELVWHDGYMKIAIRDFAVETEAPANYHYTEIKLYPGDTVSGSVLNGSNMVAGVAVCEQPHFLHNARFSQEVGTTRPETSGTLQTFSFSYTAAKVCTVIVTSNKNATPNVTIARASIDHLTNPPFYPQYKNVLNCVWQEGYYASSDHTFNASTVYHTSNPIYLPAGARLCVKATGSGSSSILTVWNTSGQFVASTAGNWERWDRNFVAESNCYVTVARRVTATQIEGVDMPYFPDNANAPIVYVNSYLSESPLYGKKMLVIGDSLIYGHTIGNAITWPNLLAMKYGMTVDNHGINGSTVAVVTGQTTYPMCVRYADITTENPDIVIVEGGANDRNKQVPIGMNIDTDTGTFKGALNTLIDGLRSKYPHAVIMMMTTYHRLRRGGGNSMPDELRYSIAMMEVCEFRGIPCYNNMMSGIDMSDANIRTWADEGLWLDVAMNYHFSEAAYKFLVRQYEKWIESFIPYE